MVVYQNRKNKKYYLHHHLDNKGKTRFHFAAHDSEKTLAESIPSGYEIYEHPNAQVFLRRVPVKIIFDDEIASVKKELEKHCHIKKPIVDVRKNTISIYTPNGDIDELAEIFSQYGSVDTNILESIEHQLEYSDVMKFELHDKKYRLFVPFRYCYVGNVDDWIPIGKPNLLKFHVKTLIKYIGTDDYFDLNLPV